MADAAYRIEIMHGVNLDMLGHRDPAIYGTLTLPELQVRIEEYAVELGGCACASPRPTSKAS